jgi:hypothetical protein
MSVVAVFAIAFVVGVLTGIVVVLSSKNRRTGHYTHAPRSRAMSSDD